MKNRFQIFRGKAQKKMIGLIVVLMMLGLVCSPKSFAGYSGSPRQTGEEVLDELLMGSNRFIIRVESNGCTDKSSFKVEIKKEADVTSQTPRYNLTIVRIRPDECKAIVEGGTLILFDLERDLGLKGNFTYSITNKVYSSAKIQSSDDSMFSIIEKHFTVDFPEIKEVRPEPFSQFIMDHDYFTCYVPADWKLERDKDEDEKAGIFEIRLTVPEKAKPEDGDKYFFPDPLIYVGYYAKTNDQNKTFESFVKDYDDLALKRAGSDQSNYQKPKMIQVNGNEAREITYEVYQEVPRGPLFVTKYWLKAKFIVIKAKEGFYVLAFKSPREFYDKYLPAFDEITKTFKF